MANEKILRELIESDEKKKWTEIVNEMLGIMRGPISMDRKIELVNDLALDLLFVSIIMGTAFPMSEIVEFEWKRSSFENWLSDKSFES